MSRTNQILLVLKTPPPYGGGEMRAQWLSDHFRDRERYVQFLIQHVSQDRRNVGAPSWRRVYEFICDEARLIWLLLRYRPALVYKNMGHKTLNFLRDSMYFWTARCTGAHFIGELAGERFSFLTGTGMMALYGRFVLSRFCSIRVLGRQIAADFAAKGITNVWVSDNGVPVPRIDMCSPNDGRQPIRLLFVGLHSHQKGFDVLVQAVSRLLQRGTNCELHTIGEWYSAEFQSRTETLIETQGFSSAFHFHGLMTGEDKWSMFAKSHVFVLPSLTEGQPLSMLEALGCGMPVVASSVGGIPDVIEHGVNGFLVAPGDPVRLADALLSFSDDSQMWERISKANRELYLSRFTLDAYLKNCGAWFTKCANGH